MSAMHGIIFYTSIIAAILDFRTGRIPNVVTYTAFIVLVILACMASDSAAVLGCVCTTAPLLLLHILTKGKGMGLGDVKFAACIGVAFGPEQGLITLGFAFIAGGLFALYGLISGTFALKSRIPFAPFLTAGVLFQLYLPLRILGW
jgi:leader peptidase (prepilin peptidase)/N-methyltransferase